MNENACVERMRIVNHIREGASRLLNMAMTGQVPNVADAELSVSVMEEIANAIEEGDHWREFT